MSAAKDAVTEQRAGVLLELEREITVLRRRVKRVVASRARLIHPELQRSGYHLLLWITENGPSRASQLVEAFEIDKGAISRQLQHLIDLGLLVREPDPKDGRASLLTASGKATSAMSRVAAQRREWTGRQLADWSVDDLADFVGRLHRYNEVLENAPES